MNKSNILYWAITGIFAAFMIFTAIPDILMMPDAVDFITKLGYPHYFIPFIGVAKVLGGIAILIPGFPRVTEWAYAGLFYDLVAAVYSQLATSGFDPGIFFMVLPFSFIVASYFLYHQRLSTNG